MIDFNKKQKHIIDLGVNHLRSNTGPQVFEFTGLAGTGKSTVIYEILRRSGISMDRVVPMAYIGQAAINMRLKGLLNAKTIHSHIYEPIEIPITDSKGNIIMDPYFNRPKYRLEFIPKEVHGDVMFIDEAGSVPYHMKKEIEDHGIKIIATGDIAQLPPVMDKPAYLTNPNIIQLDEIMRQDAGSNILYIADRARRGLPIHKGNYGNVLVIEQEDLNDAMLMNAETIIVGKNKTRDKYNNHIRRNILNIKSSYPVIGDKLVCRKNNWKVGIDGINLANGLTGSVINNPNVRNYDKDIININFKPYMLNNSFDNLDINYKYLTSPHSIRQQLKNSKYMRGEQFEYGYALTTHLAQGSEYNNGIYIEEYLHPSIQKNLNYTGITRFKKSMIYVLQPRKKFY